MKDLNKDANVVLESATAKVNANDYTGRETAIMAVELHVRLASAHAQMAIARQAEIANLLQARKEFANSPDIFMSINARLVDLMGF
jgi:hypothetical protein